MHSHLWCTKTLLTSFCRTDDINRINYAIRQRETMGNIIERGFITRLYSATVATDSFMEKKYINRAKLTAQCVYTFYRQLHLPAACEYDIFSEQFMYNNARGFFLLWRTLPSPPPPLVPCGYQIYVHSLSTNKGLNDKRCLFESFYFYYLMIIQILLAKITCN